MPPHPPVVRGLWWARGRHAPVTPPVPRGVAPAVRGSASVHACSRGPSTLGAQGVNPDQEASSGGAPASLTRRRWVVDLGRGPGGVGGARAGPAYVWSPGAPMTGCRAQAAVIAHVDASVRPHVRAEPTPARVGGHRTDADLSRGRCLVLTGDLVLCPRAEAMVAEGHANAVRGEICAGVVAGADGRAGHDPILVPDRGVHPRAPGGRVPWRAARGAADHGQGRDVDQAGVTGRPPPATRSCPGGGSRRARVHVWSPPTMPSRPPQTLVVVEPWPPRVAVRPGAMACRARR